MACGDRGLLLAELSPDPLALVPAFGCMVGGLGEREVLLAVMLAFIGELDNLGSKRLGKRLIADIQTPMTVSSLPDEDKDELLIVGVATIIEVNSYRPVAVVFSERNSMSL